MNIRQIIKSSPLDTPLSTTESEFIRQCILKSPTIGNGVKNRATGSEVYRVTKVGKRKTKMIVMCYADRQIPLTIKQLEGKGQPTMTNRAKVMRACRDIVEPQIKQFRQLFWSTYAEKVRIAFASGNLLPSPPVCPLSGQFLEPRLTHVDHVEPFVRLVEQWLSENNIDIEKVKARKSRDLKRYTLGSEKLDKSWYNYHKENAQLQLVEAKANLKKGCKFNE